MVRKNKVRALSLVLVLLVLSLNIFSQNLAINEFMSSNSNTIADEDMDYEDWIEICNVGTTPIPLAGYGLSDNSDNPFKWVFPEITIQPGQFMVIWASGKNRTNPTAPLHTNFSIKAEGEEVLLTHPNGTTIDEIQPLSVPRDVSYGKKPDGTGAMFFFDMPTPGSANTTTAYPAVVADPVFSRQGGLYTEPFTLTLQAEEGAMIFYTTNGNTPTPGSGSLYTAPIYISGTVIIRARAYKSGYLQCEPKTMIYSRIAQNTQGFKSNLPVIIIHQFNIPITPGDATPASIVFIDHNDGDTTTLTGEIALQSRMLADIRGISAQSFPKNMYGFELVDELDANRDKSLFGMPAEHNWILYAPYSDKTLMRNAIAYTLGSKFGRWAPRIRFVELFLHSGYGSVTSTHYHGVYMLVERIKWGEDRVNITKIKPVNNTEPEIAGGYIIKRDRLNPGEIGMTTNMGTTLAFVRPVESDITVQQKNWIRNYMSGFEAALFGSNFMNPITGYKSFIHTESFIDHFLITELLKEIDGYRLSTFMYKNRYGKLVMGPVWDFNLSIGNADYLQGWLPQGWYYPLEAQQACGNWYVRMLQDPSFQQRLSNRWWKHRQDIFSNEYLTNLIFGFKDTLEQAQERNFVRWPILGQYVWPNWYIGQTYQDEVNWMHTWLMNRLAWIDSQMGVPPVIPEYELLYYWLFDTSLPNDTPLEQIPATFQICGDENIQFHSALAGYPFYSGHPNWRKASMERRNAPTEINYRTEGNNHVAYANANMRGLQIRQPFTGNAGENYLIFNLPTTYYQNVVFRFAAKDENAVEYLIPEYAVNSGDPVWISNGLPANSLPIGSSYQLYEIDFNGIQAASNNPDFKIRIRFGGSNMTADNGDRVTFNNFSLDGELMQGINLPPEVANPPGFQKLIESGNSLTLDINQIFSDPDNDPMTFSVFTDHEQMIGLSLEGNIVTITPLLRGGANINLSAEDGNHLPVATSFRVLIYPEAYQYSRNAYSFTSWDSNEPEYSYPAHMIFLQSDIEDPGLDNPLIFPYFIPHDDYHINDQGTIGFPYNNTGRTRINGLGTDGISFINTGRSRDLGGTLLAIDTRGISSASLSWLGGTIIQNTRIYAMRLQYRTDIEAPFSDFLVNGQPLEYVAAYSGNVTQFEAVPFPSEMLNKEYVQLLWRYYFYSGELGSRSEIRLDEIHFSDITAVSEVSEEYSMVYFSEGLVHIRLPVEADGALDIFDITGRHIFNRSLACSIIHAVDPGLKSGIYFLRVVAGNRISAQKIIIGL